MSDTGGRPERAADPVKAGVLGRCPRCGEGKLFAGFLTVAPRCANCDLDYSFIDSGDGPAVFVILIVGFIVVGMALWVEVAYDPPLWVHAAVTLPLLILACVPIIRAIASVN